ncbi:MAG: hypothetical protein OXR72_06505 [Gemmatimonadota bacterium]|nr:hypothetical protein [Gemmatimonadota bacterium]
MKTQKREGIQTRGELLMSARIIPIGREGKRVFARMLRPGEQDNGRKVHLRPGDQLVIPPGGLEINSAEIDALNKEGMGGYAPVANTVWTWYRIVDEQVGFFLFFFALARRMDAAHAVWTLAMKEREKAQVEGGISGRARFFNELATAEMTVIALHRGITMVYKLVEKFCPDLEVPETVRRIRKAVQEIRHAFEHIDDRAEAIEGMSGKLHSDALTIFNQPDFIESSILRYKEHSLDFNEDVLAALLECRDLVMKAIDSRAEAQSRDLGSKEN